MNDVQSTLLAQKGNESDLSIDIQNRILSKLGVNKETAVNTATSTSSTVTDKIKLTTENGQTKIVDDTPDNRKKATDRNMTIEPVIVEKPQTEIKQEEKLIDSATTETAMNQTKKTPADFGQINQPVFETLESILKVIDMPMTGEEIKNTFDISPGLKINSKTTFRPLS